MVQIRLLNININCHFITDEKVWQCEIQFLIISFWYSTNLLLSWSCWLFIPLVMEILWSICLRRDPQMDRKAVIGGCIYDLSFWISWIRLEYIQIMKVFHHIFDFILFLNLKILELSDLLYFFVAYWGWLEINVFTKKPYWDKRRCIQLQNDCLGPDYCPFIFF